MSGLTPEQLERRRSGIGASEIAALAGLSRWSSPIAIYESKVYGVRSEAGLPAYLGTALEEPLAKLYAQEHPGDHLATCDTLGSGIYLATPDRLVFDAPHGHVETLEEVAAAHRNVQIKTTSWRQAREWGEPGSDQIPEEYLAQVTWEMGVTGLPVSDVYVLFDRERTACYRVEFNGELWAGLTEIAERFWRDHVVARVPPPADATERYREFLGRAFPVVQGPVVPVESGSDLETVVWQYARLSLAAGRLKKARAQAENVIKSRIGEALGLVGSFGSVKWHRSPPKKDSPDWEAVAREAQGIARLALQGLLQGAAVDREALAKWCQDLETVEQRHRKAGRGYSALRAKWSPDALASLRELQLRLDAAQDEANDDDEGQPASPA